MRRTDGRKASAVLLEPAGKAGRLNLNNFKDVHRGETCIVVGNGLSLRDVPNIFLDRFPTFGTNGIFKRYHPTYYIYVDPDVEKLSYSLDEINVMKSKKFVALEITELIQDSIPLNVVHALGFSVNPTEKVYGYFSSSTVMLQLAYWMGFERVGLVGFDHRYTTPAGMRAWHSAKMDVSHFVPDYYPPGTQWKAPDLFKLAAFFRLAKDVFEKDDRQVINLTKHSALDVFQPGELFE